MPMPSRFLLATLVEKVLLYGSLRLWYPLANFLREDWDLSRQDIGWLLAAGEFAGVFSGFVTVLADTQHGSNRSIGILSWVAVTLVGFLLLAPPVFAVLLTLRFISQFFATIFYIVSQSAVVTQVSESERGFVTGMSESSWALSILVLVPIMLTIYERAGWRWMFATLAVLHVPFVWEIYMQFPVDERVGDAATKRDALQEGGTDGLGAPAQAGTQANGSFRASPASAPPASAEQGLHDTDASVPSYGSQQAGDSAARAPQRKEKLNSDSGLARKYWDVLVSPGPLLFNLSALSFNIGHNLLFIALTDLAHDDGLDAEEMTGPSLAVGFGELAGVVLIIAFGDRYGLDPTIKLSLLLFCAAAGVFTAVGRHSSLTAAIATIFFVYAVGEVAYVSQIAFVERFVGPEARSTLLGVHFQSHFAGRALGAAVAEPLWSAGGIGATGTFSVVTSVVAVLLYLASLPFLPTERSGAGADATSEPAVEDKSKADVASNDMEVDSEQVSHAQSAVAHV